MKTDTEPNPTELHTTIKLGIAAHVATNCSYSLFHPLGSQSAEGPGSVGVHGPGYRGDQFQGRTPRRARDDPDRPRATVYQHLGVDYNHYLNNMEGLPMRILPFGKPIKELVS